ncbi:MAG: methylmalonyl-CoA epimerase [Anaerolineaceae bacterium]|nr:methylmalonyl-CoA epimerase [Anaerolineaceae bacterium]MCY3905831.1 methylmalonyl-CoA epimerase [Anaerolineaceae bacterium]
MPRIAIDHIAIVVSDMDAALGFWQQALGLELRRIESVHAEEVDVAFLETENAHVELLLPTSEDSGIARYLATRGPGMHHLCLAVTDIEAAMEGLVAAGIELINERPRQRGDGTRYAFVHPKSSGGVLVELYQKA